jgi:hypothetical protein
MKKPMVLSVIMIALLLLVGSVLTPSSAQAPTTDDTPTFYRLVPGTYVNGWPRFTVTYPKEWVEKRRTMVDVFLAEPPPSAPRSARSVLSVCIGSTPVPIEKLTEIMLPLYKAGAQDVTVVSNKPSRLSDGTPAWEAEFTMARNGEPVRVMNVVSEKEGVWVMLSTRSYTGKIEDSQRAMLYSLRYEEGKDKPVTVPPDVREFLDNTCSAHVSHDIAKIWSYYSDRFLLSGDTKQAFQRFFTKEWYDRETSSEIVITDFVPEGDRAYLVGPVTGASGTTMLRETSIIKENGAWKWYGNQRDATP